MDRVDTTFGRRTASPALGSTFPTHLAAPFNQTSPIPYPGPVSSSPSMELYTVIATCASLLIIISFVAFSAIFRNKMWAQHPTNPKIETKPETDLETVKRILETNLTPEIITLLEDTIESEIIDQIEEEQRPRVRKQLKKEERDGVREELKKSEREGVLKYLREHERDAVRAKIDEKERKRLRKEGMIDAMADNYRRGIERGRMQVLEERREALRRARKREDERDGSHDDDDESSSGEE